MGLTLATVTSSSHRARSARAPRAFLIGVLWLVLGGLGVPAVAFADDPGGPGSGAASGGDPVSGNSPSPDEPPSPSESPTESVSPTASPSPSEPPTSASPPPAETTSPVEPPTPTPVEPVPAPAPTPTPVPAPTPDCRGAKDSRKTSKAKRTPFTVCGIAVVSKKHRITSAHKPRLVTVKGIKLSGLSRAQLAPEAAAALQAMAQDARRNGHILVIRSAYRSYATQRGLYRPGKKLTAPAGASEHQLGLAVDLAALQRGRVVRGYAFGTSAAGRWVSQNAARYGFILRYPNGKQKITGIPHEPWHYRWVGVEHAGRIAAVPGQTLERYLKVS